MDAVRDLAPEKPERERRQNDHKQPVGGELGGVLVRPQHDIAEEVDQEVKDHGDSGRNHQPCENHPGKVALVERPKEFPHRLAKRSTWRRGEGSEALCGRRPNRVVNRSDHAPTSGGTVMANTPPRPSATPMAVFRTSLGTTSSTWAWIRTVVSGIQRKLLPNQNALSAVCCRFP